MLRACLVLSFYLVFGLLAAMVGLPVFWITGRVSFLYRISMWVASRGLMVAGVKSTIKGLEHLPPRSCIIMCNHRSNLDPPLIFPPVPRPLSIFLKKEVMRVPILSTGMKAARMIPIDRSNRDSAIQSVREAEKVLADGVSILVFPEGTRSPDEHLLPFKKGAFHLAVDTNTPIVPASIRGTEKMMPKGSLRIIAGTAEIAFHPAIYPEKFATREDLMAAVRASIEAGLADERVAPVAGLA